MEKEGILQKKWWDKGLHFAAHAFLALLFLYVFLCCSFFTMPKLVMRTVRYASVTVLAAAVFFSFPRLLKEKWTLILVGLLAAALAGSYIYHRSALEYICNTGLFLGTLWILPLLRLKTRTLWVLLGVFLLYALLLCIFAGRSWRDKDVLIHINANTSSFVCLLAEVVLLAFATRFQDWKKQFLFYAAAAVFLFFHIRFGGRSSLIVTALFLVYFLLKRFFGKTPKWGVILLVALLFSLGILFAYFFSMLLPAWLDGEGLVIWGKDIFTGREDVWADAFEQFDFLGLGYKFETKYWQSGEYKEGWNLHNQPMGYLIGFGVFAFVFYTLTLAWLAGKICRGKKMTAGFLIALVVGSYFETCLFSTGHIVYLPVVLVLLQACDKEAETRKVGLKIPVLTELAATEPCAAQNTEEKGEKMQFHYCWVGGAEKSEKIKRCMESWKRVCPNAEIVEWNESNYDVYKIPYIRQAYEQKKYAFVSDYMRFDILYNYGGVYLDTDVELLKDVTPLTKENFTGFESDENVAPGLILCAKKGSALMKEMLDYYDAQTEFSIEKTVVHIMTEILSKHGLKRDGSLQKVADFVIYPTEYFNPKGGEYGKDKITENTYSIHHYEASWKSPLDQKIMRFRVKYGNRKGRILFVLCHPFLTMQKWKEKRNRKKGE